ncbi:MAG: PAS domain S-box protein [Candidatus Binatia bacterium]
MNERLSFPLRVLIPFLFGVGSAIIATLSLQTSVRQAVTTVEQEAREEFKQDMSVLQGAVEHLLAGNDMVGVQAVVASVGLYPDLQHVVVVDANDIVVAATRREWTSRSVTDLEKNTPLTASWCTRHQRIGTVVLSADRRHLLGCYPIGGTGAGTIGNPTGNGYLFASADVSGRKEKARAQMLQQGLTTWGLFGTMLVGLWLLLRTKLAQRRISHIVSAAEQFAAGNLTARSELRGRDEIGAIGAAFDRMAAELQDTIRAREEAQESLVHANSELDLRVQERTNALMVMNTALQEEIASHKQTEEQLRESEERFRRAFDDAGTGMAMVSIDQQWLTVNRALCALLGYSPEELQRQTFSDVLYGDDRAAVNELCQHLLSGTQNYGHQESRCLHKDGHILSVLLSLSLLYDRQDQPLYFIVQVIDISKRKVAEDEVRRREAWLSGLINTTQDAVISINRQGRIVRFNPAAERIFGYSVGEVVGQNVAMLMPPHHARQHDDYIHRYEETREPYIIGTIRVETGRRRTGELFPIELSVTEIEEDTEVRYGAFIRDISERVKLQQRVIGQERLATIGTMAAKLAHEIGNPLNSMSLNAQMLERRLAKTVDGPDERLLVYLQNVQSEIHRLTQLLHDFRALSQRQHSDFRAVSVRDLIRDVLRTESPHYSARQIYVASEVPAELPAVRGDADKLRQVLLNLTKNAVEAMPQGGTLTVRASAHDGHIHIDVVDTGIGVGDELKVFEPFKTTKPEGTGLGLAIVQEIVDAHRGKVSYASAPDQGTTFSVSLPIVGPEKIAVVNHL